MQKFLFLAVLVLVPSLAQAQDASTYFWVEAQVSEEKNGETKKIGSGEYFGTISFGKQWSAKKGIFIQGSHGNLWGETVIGPAFQLTEDINVGAAIGVEHYAPNPLRLRLRMDVDDVDTGSFIYFQYDWGKSDQWLWLDVAAMYNESFGVGVLIQMPDGGAGPKFEFRGGEHLGFWVAPVYDWRGKKPRLILGGRLMFEK